MNIFIKNTQTGETKQFKEGLKLKSFVQSLTDKPIKGSDEAIEHLKNSCDTWQIAYEQKEKFNLNY